MAIKEYQRDVLRGVFGLRHVVCTYDPLTGVNAYRNIHHFGMSVLEYRVATYGEYGGRLNRRDVPSDRFFMDWDLEAPPRRPAFDLADLLEGTVPVLQVEERTVAGRSGPLELEVVGGAAPDPGGPFALVRIPRDFYLMLRETDVDDSRSGASPWIGGWPRGRRSLCPLRARLPDDRFPRREAARARRAGTSCAGIEPVRRPGRNLL